MGIVLLLILLIVVFVVAGDLFKGDSSESSKTTTAVSETTEITEMQEATTTAVGSAMPQLLGKNFENAKRSTSWITFDEEEYTAMSTPWSDLLAGIRSRCNFRFLGKGKGSGQQGFCNG
ncbi:MAG: hypothetical protein ACLR5S_09205 [Ruminococcus sp.]